jgi:hypothetical protein
MFVTDQKGQKWKVTIDGEDTLYFYVQEKIGTNPVVEVPAADLAAYYELSKEEQKKFELNLGRSIGLPFWPMFVRRIIEPEEKRMRGLGIFGREHDGRIREEDVCSLIVPLAREDALQAYPHLEPSQECCREYEILFQREKEEILAQAVMAMHCPIDPQDEYKTMVLTTKAQLEIDCCLLCCSPATAVGVYQPEDGNESVILHGLCDRCRPRDEDKHQKIPEIAQAIEKLAQKGRIPHVEETFPDES